MTPKDALWAFATSVRNMRIAQQHYFGNRTRKMLDRCKQLEADVDEKVGIIFRALDDSERQNPIIRSTRTAEEGAVGDSPQRLRETKG